MVKLNASRNTFISHKIDRIVGLSIDGNGGEILKYKTRQYELYYSGGEILEGVCGKGVL